MCVLCVRALFVIHHPLCGLSHQDVGHKQSRDGGEGQAQPGGPGQAGRSVAEVGVAARLGEAVDGGVGGAFGEVHVFRLVALSLL